MTSQLIERPIGVFDSGFGGLTVARAVAQRLVVQVPRRLLRNGDVLRVHFKGYTASYSE